MILTDRIFLLLTVRLRHLYRILRIEQEVTLPLSSIHPLTHSLTHSPIHSLTHSLTHSLRRNGTESDSVMRRKLKGLAKSGGRAGRSTPTPAPSSQGYCARYHSLTHAPHPTQHRHLTHQPIHSLPPYSGGVSPMACRPDLYPVGEE